MLATTVAAVDHTTAAQWLWVILPTILGAGAIVWLAATGDAGGRRGPLALAHRVASSLRRTTGLPAWCASGALVADISLAVAAVGFFWDVAWHIDLGRDRELFTVPHTLILMGLGGLGIAALASIGFATLEDAEVGWRLRRLRIPRAALALGVLSAGAIAGFPLDDIWHANYGVDVTMWSPTHLLMIGGASFGPIAMWLLLVEAGPGAGRAWARGTLMRAGVGATIIGLSTFQLEFDYGVPQWQALYQPVLIALATSVALVAARVAFGRGRALLVAANFDLIRGGFALLVGPGLGHIVPRFPLYLGIAAAVEVAAFVAERRRWDVLRTALLCGGAAGTIGLATEWGFSHLWGREPWQPSLLWGIWAAVLVAVGGAVIGAAMGRVLSFRAPAVPRTALALAAAAVVVGLIVPLPRHGSGASAVMRTTAAGPATPVLDRNGMLAFEQPVAVDLRLNPPDAAVGADWFEVVSWQGGGARQTPLVPAGNGEYRTAAPVPTGGSWKSLVMLLRRDVVAAAPVAMPADPDYGLPPVPVAARRTVELGPATTWLIRETHGGAAWPAVVAYSGFGSLVVLWMGVLAAAFAGVSRAAGGGGGGGGERPGLRAPRPAVAAARAAAVRPVAR